MFAEFVTQNIIWVGAFVVLANLLIWTMFQANVRGVATVPVLQLPKLQRSGNYVIIDVNEAAMFSSSHIPQAINFPLATLKPDNTDLIKLKDKTAIIVCQNGTKSAKAAKQLLQLGFKDLHILRGGLLAWTKESLPVTAA